MSSGLTPDLFFAAWVSFLLCFWILRRELPLPIVFGIVLARISAAVVYFGVFFANSPWHFLDDLNYLAAASKLRAEGFNPLNTLTTSEGLTALVIVSDGNHFLYRWWNLFATWLFGDHYYSPVFLNIVLSCLAAVYFRNTLRVLNYSERYQKAYLCFLLLQWDMLAWSTVTNMKESMMMCFTAAAFYYLVKLTIKFRGRDLLGLGTVLFLFFWIRFYLAFLVPAAWGLWLTIQWKSWKKIFLAPLFFYILLKAGSSSGGESVSFLRPDQLLIGVIRFPLTPQPWQIEPEYTFLILPSILHWLTLIPAAGAALALWRTRSRERILLCYLLITTLFFALVPEVQGPRHRVQITFLIAWLQFHAFYLWSQGRQTQKTPSASPALSPLPVQPSP